MANKTHTKVAKKAKPRKTAPKSPSREAAKPTLLSGGNPQIAKGYGQPNCPANECEVLS
jgi:hypothetical protein